MSAVSAPEPVSGQGSAAEPLNLMRLCHDLRQYVAAGLLLSESTTAPDSAESDHSRMVLIHQQFAAIAELLTAESGAAGRVGVVNLSRLVSECAEVVRLTYRVPVLVEQSARVLVRGDQALLRRSISNILDNACRATGSSGRVCARVEVSAGEARVEVSDGGAGFGGISSGTGHGLQVVAAAVRACHGRMEIASGPGPGTTVRLCLPATRRSVGPA